MFYDRFEELCKRKGVSPSRACIEMGKSRSLAAKWKNTGQSPRADMMPAMADYFGVTVGYLLGEEKEKPTGDADGLDSELIRLLMDLTPDEAEKVSAFIEGLKASRK